AIGCRSDSSRISLANAALRRSGRRYGKVFSRVARRPLAQSRVDYAFTVASRDACRFGSIKNRRRLFQQRLALSFVCLEQRWRTPGSAPDNRQLSGWKFPRSKYFGGDPSFRAACPVAAPLPRDSKRLLQRLARSPRSSSESRSRQFYET